ncbi:uncharacterized protein LOC115700532 isoform X3 [Cannabis sativa]|uniref:uncharacterized protein LOC115700532 isoform X3 n=1 Tax=Cannabis sativa TaxID=3483 RepID=UPI0029CA0101|nr:uncharacterized protein LOC115700532 isoform X3 [Cannabis sativa]
MKKLKGKDDKPDGLEITSIGSLYGGPLDKKYWSSSRGKDRYPYPVGYQAVRAHNGSVYRMEINEGPKGPVFMITSADGHSSSGQTPDIAWEKFQKNCSSRPKILHGKRFSCNIDGVEFFGFKNPFIQRLLREMVANVSGAAEQIFLSSTSCKETGKEDPTSHGSDSCNLPHLASSRITGKSRRREITNTKSSSKVNRKRSRPQDLKNNAEAIDPVEENKESANCKPPPVLSPSIYLLPFQEEKSHVSEKDLQSNSFGISNHLRGVVPAEETMVPITSGNCTSTGLTVTVANKENTLDRLPDPGDYPDENVVDLYAPDSFDLVQDISTGPGGCDDKNVIELYAPDTLDVVQAEMVISEGLASESNPEEEIGTSNSGKSEIDSVGQETAKSMMTFLLPQAIPLLKKSSRKKKAVVSSLEIRSRVVPSENQNNAVMNAENKMVDMEELMNIQCTSLGYSDARKCVADHLSVHQVSYHEIMPFGDSKADQVCFHEEACPRDTLGPPIGVQEHNKPLDCCLETTERKDKLCCNEVNVESDGAICQADHDISESLPSCNISKKNEFAEEIRDACASIDENLVAVGTDDNSKSQGILSSQSLLLEESGVKTVLEETCNMSLTQTPSLVYSRRKKVESIKHKSKYRAPLSESIICRTFADSCVPETSTTMGNCNTLEASEMGWSYDRSCKDVFGSESMISGPSKSIPVYRPTTDCKSLLNNTVSAVSHDQSIMCLSSLHVDKEIRHENPLVRKSSESCKKQAASNSHSSSYIAEECQYSSDFKPKGMPMEKDLLGNFDLVGCYVHPLPVLSLTVSTGDNEIHICVLCDLLDKYRTLFIYKVATHEPTAGYPSFVGHTSVLFPVQKDYFGREIDLERSGVQFTPGGLYLLLLDSIRTPYCRQGRIPCTCSVCASSSFEGNAVKIVEVNLGYVSVVGKLTTAESLQHLLVCEPNRLVAVGESGRLHLWVMNPTWCAQVEKFILPANAFVSPGIVEIKKIPKCTSLVLGHNGFGEFSLWDISKRIIVSKFTSPSTSFCKFIPVGLFNWKKKGQSFRDTTVEESVHRMITATNMCFSVQTNDDSLLPLDGEDVAVWLLVSVMPDSDVEHDYKSSDYQTKSVGWWRLALLVKNTVIIGSILDPSAAAIGASAGHGIIGTHDGLVYMWEMSTGTKLGTLHHFKGSNVSCIATDDSMKGALAVAGGEEVHSKVCKRLLRSKGCNLRWSSTQTCCQSSTICLF